MTFASARSRRPAALSLTLWWCAEWRHENCRSCPRSRRCWPSRCRRFRRPGRTSRSGTASGRSSSGTATRSRSGSRNERPTTRYFPELVAAFGSELPERCVVDGEIVLATGAGLDFEALQQRIHPAASRVALLSAQTPASFVAFDLLALGDDTGQPFAQRRAALEHASCHARAPVHLTPATTDRDLALRWFDQFEGAGLDGVVTKFDQHPWNWADRMADVRNPRDYEGSRWNAGKDLSFVPLRPERVVEVRYDHMEGVRFRHTAQFVRWRPDRTPASCTFAQLDQPVSFDLNDIVPGLR